MDAPTDAKDYTCIKLYFSDQTEGNVQAHRNDRRYNIPKDWIWNWCEYEDETLVYGDIIRVAIPTWWARKQGMIL